MEYRIVFHPKAEAELEQLYDDMAERASPAIAWNLLPGSATIAWVCRLFHSAAQSGLRFYLGYGLLVTGAPSALRLRSKANGC